MFILPPHTVRRIREIRLPLCAVLLAKGGCTKYVLNAGVLIIVAHKFLFIYYYFEI